MNTPRQPHPGTARHTFGWRLVRWATVTSTLWAVGQLTTPAAGLIHPDAAAQTITLQDRPGDLRLRLSYGGKCVLDRVVVRGRDVVTPETGVATAIKAGGEWFSTRKGIATPQVAVTGNTVSVTGIAFSGGGLALREAWKFTALEDRILWRIERQYLSGGTLEDIGLPGWDFASLDTWTGALLGHGGVAWFKLFDAPNATYGVHTGPATFWNRGVNDALRILPSSAPGTKLAVRFSRQPGGGLTFHYSVSDQERTPQHGLARFLRERQDVWAPFKVAPGTVWAEYSLQALDYGLAFDRGRLPGIDAGSVRELLHTIARIGAVDARHHGSNGYYSGYAVLHEPWIAQLGLALDDPGYFQAYAETLDYQRDHALGPDGRVKSRWSYEPGDARPGTYDALGFYECQWGWLMDSQPSYVINVAEQFDFTGDVPWVRRHKAACEKALDYLLRQDTDADGLLEMKTASHTAAKGSDWIDVVWAAFENAFVNAQMYRALELWAGVERVLGDLRSATRFAQRAQQLKTAFNRPVARGGFWDPERRWYVYWRDQDDTVHGNNLVTPVNFMAIGYGLCDDPARCLPLLDEIERRMQAEGLFFWPLCFESFAPGEAHPSQYPFPTYENGDLFLAWGELGTRAYARHQPQVALKYVRRVLDQYARDGLAFQRYLRKSQSGAGQDILANNCSPVVGLYRNLYGVQPKHNRLYLEPHLTPELDGAQFPYWLRHQTYRLELRTNACRVSVNGLALEAAPPFGLHATNRTLTFFPGQSEVAQLTVTRPSDEPLTVAVESWPPLGQSRQWTIHAARPGLRLTCAVGGLAPHTSYVVWRDETPRRFRSDADGALRFAVTGRGQGSVWFEVRPARD